MAQAQDPKDLDAATRERLGRLTLALAENVFAIGDPGLSAAMRSLMLEVGRAIARNLDEDQGERWTQ